MYNIMNVNVKILKNKKYKAKNKSKIGKDKTLYNKNCYQLHEE